MSNEKDSLETLLARLPRHRQLLLRDSLKRSGIYEKDPLILLFLEVLENQDRAITEGLKKEKEVLHGIYHHKTWRKILASRLLSWVVGPLLASAVILTSIHLSRKDEIQALQKVVDNPKGLGLAMMEGAKAIRDSRVQLKTLMIMTSLLSMPEGTLKISKQQLVISFPKDSATVQQDEKDISIRINIPADINKIIREISAETKQPVEPIDLRLEQ